MNLYNSKITKPNKILYHSSQIIWYILGLIEIILAFRFILKLLAANPSASFTNLTYTLSYPLVAPFLNVFKTARLEANIFEWTTLLAMSIYALIAWAIVKIFFMTKEISDSEAGDKLERDNK